MILYLSTVVLSRMPRPHCRPPPRLTGRRDGSCSWLCTSWRLSSAPTSSPFNLPRQSTPHPQSSPHLYTPLHLLLSLLPPHIPNPQLPPFHCPTTIQLPYYHSTALLVNTILSLKFNKHFLSTTCQSFNLTFYLCS